MPSPKRAKMTPLLNTNVDPEGKAAATKSVSTASPMVAAAPFLRIKKLSEHGRLPERGSPNAAGYDLFSAADISVPARGKALVPTDISLAFPGGYYGRVAPRSGLALKHFVDVGAGVVDADYRGPLGVVLFNFGEADFAIRRGDRVAQLILTKIITPEIELVDDLDGTSRGAGGFGSTGV